jgi:hypothetical protein
VEYYGNGERVVVLGQETVEVKKSGVTVPIASTPLSWTSARR